MLETLYCKIDDFCKFFLKEFYKYLVVEKEKKRKRKSKLSISEIMTISIYYHYSGYKSFKDYYEKGVLVYMQKDFKELVSYNRFLELRKKVFIQIIIFSHLNLEQKCTKTSFIDSFPLNICHKKRISSNKVFKKFAKHGKTSVGWFYGFKLHLIINEKGDILSFAITPGNISDNNENLLNRITKDLYGKFFGDKGYLLNKASFENLYSKGKHFITKIRRNMKNKFMDFKDKIILKKRGIIESVGAVLKQSFSLEHTRHRSIFGFFFNVFSTISSYHLKPNKPSIKSFNFIP